MNTKFVSKTEKQILNLFKTTENGLTEEQVKQKQSKEGLNILKTKKISLLKIFYQQYANFLMLLLTVGAVLSMVLGEWIDGMVIFGILFVNGILGTYQEYKAEKLTQVLNARTPQKVMVRRNGNEFMIDKKELVKGDIVILSNGQIVPADIRLIKNFGIIIDESALTGESIGVSKQTEKMQKMPKGLHQMKNIVFSGTAVLQGGGEGVVVATGEETEFGHIISLTHSTKKRSSFLQQVNSLSDLLFKVTLLILGILLVVLIIFKADLGINRIFLFAIALSIAIVPEMLPLISTISLTRASLALSKKGVLIKRLSSLEDLGGVEIICTDKTGTITKNVLSIKDIQADDHDDCLFHALMSSKEMTDPDFILAGSFDSAVWKKSSKDLQSRAKKAKKIWQGSFQPEFRWQFSIYQEDSDAQLAIKGAPEDIILKCNLDEKLKIQLIDQCSELGKQGLRVLAVAKKSVTLEKEYTEKHIKELEFLGIISFTDPIKKSAKKALAKAEQLGLQIKILTGDCAKVALQVAKKVGMNVNEHEVITPDQLKKLDSNQRYEVMMRSKIFARVNPKEKYEIIQVFAKQHSVMFLGEGINDAPALKSADVGMVVQEASDIAKESADIVLTKPDLNVIVENINFGRQIMNNISKYILVTLTGNFGSLFAISVVSIVSPILPLLPVQILLENILTDVPMISAVNSPEEKAERKRPSEQNIRQIAFYAIILGLAVLLVQFIFYKLYISLDVDLFRTLWLIEIVLFEFVLVLSLFTKDWFFKSKVLNRKTAVFFIAIVLGIILLPFVPYVNSWFHLVPYDLSYLIPIFGFTIFGLFVVELMKRLLYKTKFSY